MEKLGIILCSTVSKTKEIINDDNVDFISLSTNFKNFEIKSGEVSLTEYFKTVEKENEVPKTSQPATGAIAEVLEKAVNRFDHVIVVTISELLSGTHQNVTLAIRDLAEADQNKIALINSNCIAMTETMIYDEIQNKCDVLEFPELVEHLRAYASRFVTYAVPGSMKFLKLSGRVNTSQLVLGTLVNIKTLIKVDEKSVGLYHKGRGYKSILKKIDEEISQYQPKTVYYTSILEETKIFSAVMDLFAKHNINVVVTEEADIVSATHFGPGSFGFTMLRENTNI